MAETPTPSPSLREFLAGLFGEEHVKHIHICHFSADPGLSESKWKGRRVNGLGERGGLPPLDNQYFCIARLRDGADRVIGGVQSHHLIIADDVGTKIGPDKVAELDRIFGQPTAKIETSPGNQTWIWKLAAPIYADEVERVSHLNAVRDYMRKEGLTDAKTADAVRYIRLPFGRNTKDVYQNPFDGSFPEVRLVEWSPERELFVGLACQNMFGPDWVEKIAAGEYLDQAQSALLGPTQYDAKFDDPWVRLAQEIGLNPRQGPAGRISCDCPNMAAHTVKGDTGFAFLGGDLCECHHSACDGLRVPDFKNMMRLQYKGLSALGMLGAGLPDDPDQFIARCEFEQKSVGAGETPASVADEADQMAARQVAKAAEDARVAGELFAELCDRFVYVSATDAFWDTRTDCFMTHAQVDHDPDMLKIAEAGSKGKNRGSARLLNSGTMLRRVYRVGYFPGHPGKLIVPDQNQSGGTVLALNTYVPTTVKPVPGGIPSAWLELLAYLFPEKDKQEFLLNSMAYHLQNGDERLPLLHLLSGGQGIGKDLLLEAYFRVCGMHNLSTVMPEDFKSAFNEWLVKRNIYLPEMKLDRRDYSKIKGLIGQSVLHASINPKGVRAYPMRLSPVFWATTNDPDAVGIDADDRRVVVLHSFAKPENSAAKAKDDKIPGTQAWFSRIALELSVQDGELLDFLSRRALGPWHVHRAPDFGDGAKDDMRVASMSSAESWVLDLFAEGGLFADRTIITMTEIESESRTADLQTVRNSMTPAAMRRALAAAGFERRGQNRVSGNVRRLWAREGCHPANAFNATTGKNAAGKTLGEIYDDERSAWLAATQQANLNV